MLFFVELYMKWTRFPTLKGSNSTKICNFRIKSEMCKWSILSLVPFIIKYRSFFHMQGGEMYVIIGSHFVPLEGKFLL